MKGNLKNPLGDHYKSDIFIFGVILLNVCLLNNCENIYDFKTFTIKEKSLNFNLSKVLQKYGNNLFHFLSRMLEIDENNRIDYEDMFKENKVKNEENMIKREENSTETSLRKSYSMKDIPLQRKKSILKKNSTILIKQKSMNVKFLD